VVVCFFLFFFFRFKKTLTAKHQQLTFSILFLRLLLSLNSLAPPSSPVRALVFVVAAKKQPQQRRQRQSRRASSSEETAALFFFFDRASSPDRRRSFRFRFRSFFKLHCRDGRRRAPQAHLPQGLQASSVRGRAGEEERAGERGREREVFT